VSPLPLNASSALARATVAVTAGRPPATPNAGMNPAVEFTSTYVASDTATQPGDLTYGRWTNATWEAFEQALGALEGGTALLFGSGMAAIAATVSLVPDGGAVVLPRHVYSGTLGLLSILSERGRIVPRLVDIDDTDAVLAALPGAAMLWVETPTNPMLEVADLPALVIAGHAAGAVVAVDNTFATPLLQRPLEHGADVVVHSVTKYLAGHSDVVLGATVTAQPTLQAALHTQRTLNGAIPGPMEAFLALRGLRTLHLRVARAGENAAELARRLSAHPKVHRVRHPSLPDDPGHARAAAQMSGFGAIVAIEVAGGADGAEQVAAAVRLWVHATSLGGVESSLERRRRHPAEAGSVPDNLLRLSVGIEDVEDLWDDLSAALDTL
jgi:cystathionine gamma-synthase